MAYINQSSSGYAEAHQIDQALKGTFIVFIISLLLEKRVFFNPSKPDFNLGRFFLILVLVAIAYFTVLFKIKHEMRVGVGLIALYFIWETISSIRTGTVWGYFDFQYTRKKNPFMFWSTFVMNVIIVILTIYITIASASWKL